MTDFTRAKEIVAVTLIRVGFSRPWLVSFFIRPILQIARWCAQRNPTTEGGAEDLRSK